MSKRMITEQEVQDAIAKEIALYLVEKRPEIVARAMKRLREVLKEEKSGEKKL